MELSIHGQYKNKGGRIEFSLPVITFTEEKVYFAYCPALDLTGYGKSEREAKESFNETLSQFFSYSTNKNTLSSELKKLGWKTPKKNVIKAPSLIDMLNSNEYLADIFEEKQYRKFNQTVSIPSFA